MKRIEIIILAAILLFALAVRLYKIDRPIADWHSWRQADTAAVARNFIKEGFNPFIPKFDDMSTQANGLDNPNRYRFVEFPIYNSIIALVWKFTGVNETYARLVSTLSSLGSILFLFLIVKHFSGLKVATYSAFFFAFLPYNIFYSSSILPGPFMVFATLALYYFFIKYLEKEKNVYLILSILFSNIAVLSWPISLFFFLPLIYLSLEKYKFTAIKNIRLWIFAVLSLTPFLLWRFWMLNFPAGIPNWSFLINEGGIRFKGAFFRWIIAERLGKLILGASGFALFILGLVRLPQKEKFFYLSLLLGSILYICIFASGNVRHDYYQVPIIPTLAIFMGLGLDFLLNSKTGLVNRYMGPIVGITLVVFSFALSYFEVKGFYWINRPEIVEAGKAVDRIVPKDAAVIAPYLGDAAFLYQTNRHGYPVVDRPLDKLIDNGANYLVSVDINDSGIKKLSSDCKVLESTEKYVILELSKSCINK